MKALLPLTKHIVETDDASGESYCVLCGTTVGLDENCPEALFNLDTDGTIGRYV